MQKVEVMSDIYKCVYMTFMHNDNNNNNNNNNNINMSDIYTSVYTCTYMHNDTQ